MTFRPDLVDPLLFTQLQPSRDLELLRHTQSDLELPFERQIFANRTLRLEKIRYVGFDLDWTLADYSRDHMSRLAFELTLNAPGREVRLPARRAGRRVPHRLLPPRPDPRHRSRHGGQNEPPPLRRPRLPRAALPRRRRTSRALPPRADQPGQQPLLPRRHPLRAARGQHLLGGDRDAPARTPRRCRSSPTSSSSRTPGTRSTRSTPTARSRAASSPTSSPSCRATRSCRWPSKGSSLDGKKLMLITNSEWYYTDGLCKHLFEGLVQGVKNWREIFDLIVVIGRQARLLPQGQALREARRRQAPGRGRRAAMGRHLRRRLARRPDAAARRPGRAGPLRRRPHLRRHRLLASSPPRGAPRWWSKSWKKSC